MMDTSEIYVKMCDCEEIQGQWNPDLGVGDCWDYMWERGDGNSGHLHQAIPAFAAKEDYVWLPRQDQIQEMMIYHGASDRGALVIDVVIRFYDWIKNTNYMAGIVDSIEQLWLAFYMQDKHNKKWNGKEWEEK